MNKLWILLALFQRSSIAFNSSLTNCGVKVDINSITLSDNALATYITVKSADVSQCGVDCIDDESCNAFAAGLAEKSCFLFSDPVSYTFQKTGSEMYWDRDCLNTSSRIRTSTNSSTLSSATLAAL